MSFKPLRPLFHRNRHWATETHARPLGVFIFMGLPYLQHPVALEPHYKDPLSEEER